MSEAFIYLLITVGIVAFGSALINSFAGGGYGTLATPFLLFTGLEPIQFIPSILLSHGLVSLFLVIRVRRNPKSIGVCEVNECVYEKTTLKYILAFGILGLILSLMVMTLFNSFFIKLYIGGLTIFLGILLLFFRKRQFLYSRKKIIGISIVAAFNKGISGGGYGSVISCGQIFSGIDCKKAVSTCFHANTVISLLGFAFYIILFQNLVTFEITISMVIGALLAVPFAVKSLEKVTSFKLTIIIGILLIILGVFTFIQLF